MTKKARRITIYIIVSIFSLLIIIRLFNLQIIQGDDYQLMAEINRIRSIKVLAPRGRIFTVDGDILVDNRPRYSIMYMLPEGGDTDGSLTGEICQVLNISVEEFNERIVDRPAPFYPVTLIKDVDYEKVLEIEEKTSHIDQIYISYTPVRYYPYNNTACHISGYCSEVDKPTLDADETGELSLGDIIGRSGLEYTYDEYLRGENGYGYIQVNALEEKLGLFTHYKDEPPIGGCDVYTTISLTLQNFCEEYLDGKVGAIVVMEPNSGDVLALASSPQFDPSLFVGEVQSDAWSLLISDISHPLLNRAISGTYPAGSTFKIVDATAGLDMGVISGDEFMDETCWGGYAFGNRVYHCWARGTGHGFLDLPHALKNSCNVYFYQLGLKVGVEGLEEYSYRYNLGEYTGVDLLGEKRGQRPSISGLVEKFGEKWPRGEVLNNAIGQGQVLVTPIQMSVLVSALANNQYILKPQLVKYVISQDGDVLLHNRREVIKPFHISETSRDIILEGLKMVVDRILPNPLNLVGKTGSAENPHGETHAWFVGFGPKENPKIAFAILVEHGEYGEYHIPWALELIKFCKEHDIPDSDW